MPVSTKDRFIFVTSTAALLLAAASLAARAQSPSQGYSQGFGQGYSQGLRQSDGDSDSLSESPSQEENPSQTQDDLGGLRGTEPPLVPAQSQTQTLTQPMGGAGALDNGAGTNAGITQPGLAPENDTTDAINYGRPKPKKPVLYQLPTVPKPKPPLGYPPLPALVPYKTAPGTIRKGGGPPPTGAPPPPPGPTVAVVPFLPKPIPPKREEKPYDPLGVDVGSLRLFPYAEIDTGYDSNPNQLAGPAAGSLYAHGETGGKIQSQWSQHSLSADLRAGYYDFFQVPAANRPDIAATVDGRIDVTRDTKINLESRFGLTTEQPGSPLIAIPGAVFITNRPQIMTLGQTVGLSQQFNRLTLDLRGTFDRSSFGNATQSDGTELLLGEDDFNTYGLVGRASYELTPGFIPYIQVTGDERRYDNYFDVYGFARNSSGLDGRAGAKFEITKLITGDVSAGYAERDYVDPRLPLLATPTLNGSLIYTATPLTTFTLTAATDLSETTLPNASGAASHRVTATVAHALLRNLTLTGTGTYQINQYQGSSILEHFWSAGIGANYNLTRELVLRASYTHSVLTSNFLGDYYTDNLFLLGLKLQR